MLLEQLRAMLSRYQPLVASTTPTEREAAVLIAIHQSARDIEVILTKRAMSLSTHAGEVALPGGMCDVGDVDHTATALREASEEIGLPPSRVKIVGSLGSLVSRFGVRVTPIVGIVDELPPLHPNPDEIESIFSLPIAHLCASNITDSLAIHYEGQPFNVPEFRWEGFRIWGITSMILSDFVNQCMQGNIPLLVKEVE